MAMGILTDDQQALLRAYLNSYVEQLSNGDAGGPEITTLTAEERQNFDIEDDEDPAEFGPKKAGKIHADRVRALARDLFWSNPLWA